MCVEQRDELKSTKKKRERFMKIHSSTMKFPMYEGNNSLQGEEEELEPLLAQFNKNTDNI